MPYCIISSSKAVPSGSKLFCDHSIYCHYGINADGPQAKSAKKRSPPAGGLPVRRKRFSPYAFRSLAIPAARTAIAHVLVQQPLEGKGLLPRKVYAEVPPRVEYTLTETGCSLKPVLDAMGAWGADYPAKNR